VTNKPGRRALPGDRGWRLALDVAPVRQRPTGVGVYARSLATGLAPVLPGELTLIGLRADVDLGPSIPPSVARVPFDGRNYQQWLQFRADRVSRRAGAHLVHYTNASAPVMTRLPFVLTVHDLSLLRMPRSHPAMRLATLPMSLAAIGRARSIIVPSRSTARELSRLLRVASRRVTVVEHAQSSSLSTVVPDPTVVDRLGLAGCRYLLSVGTVEPRKNHRRLIGAFESLAARDPDLRLVLVGDPGWRSEPIYRRIAASPVADRIVMAGYVPDAALAALIAGSAAVCYISTYEGFGLPVIEAMAVGAAVVTSRVSSLPQAAGGAGVLVDPFDQADIARGIAEAMARRDELVAAGWTRTRGRTWRDVALETVEVYRWALRRRDG
jgi:glycosyltransferase involved in cell wall biosynthesis